VLSPAFISVLLLFASGIPPLEDSADKRYGARPDYRRFKDSVSPLVPFPPFLYRSVPLPFKRLLFFEFVMYSRCLNEGGTKERLAVEAERDSGFEGEARAGTDAANNA